tara:strand:- start:303 stop:1118 length:816 start_codon:yes stop_codon:yes gene_type:complete
MKIIIFGATGTIGNFLSKRYLKENNELLLFVKDQKSKKKLIKLLNLKKSDNTIVDNLNIMKKNFIKKKIDKYSFFFKKSDLIINATGDLGEIKDISNLNFKKFEKTLNINFFSNLIILQKISKFKKRNKRLSIIFFSGGGVTSYRKNFSAYSISKLALVKLVEMASKEIKDKFIQINAISPGIIQSKMIEKTLKNRKLVAKEEIKKIKLQVSSSYKTLDKIYKVINFLITKKGRKISGKLISSKWDNVENWNRKKIEKLCKSELYSIRRVQ